MGFNSGFKGLKHLSLGFNTVLCHKHLFSHLPFKPLKYLKSGTVISLEKHLSICRDNPPPSAIHTHAHNNGAEGIERDNQNRCKRNKKKMVGKEI